jgi:hypothetical protein
MSISSNPSISSTPHTAGALPPKKTIAIIGETADEIKIYKADGSFITIDDPKRGSDRSCHVGGCFAGHLLVVGYTVFEEAQQPGRPDPIYRRGIDYNDSQIFDVIIQGNYIAIAVEMMGIEIWDWEIGERLKQFTTEAPIHEMSFHVDEEKKQSYLMASIGSYSDNYKILIWSPEIEAEQAKPNAVTIDLKSKDPSEIIKEELSIKPIS